MTETYVFDTETIIAYLYSEPGHEAVAQQLTAVRDGDAEGLLTETNAAEVFYLVARFESSEESPTDSSRRAADRDLHALQRLGVEIRRADWRAVGEIKAAGHISLADAHAVALAVETDGTLLVGGDDDFVDLPVDVAVTRFRDGGV
jgi:predicted nucleic acid-binding protein